METKAKKEIIMRVNEVVRLDFIFRANNRDFLNYVTLISDNKFKMHFRVDNKSILEVLKINEIKYKEVL